MKKIKLVCGEKLYDVAKGVIKKIASNLSHKDINHIVVVPDRFSLLAEKLVFETNNIKSTLNIDVCGINKLAKSVIQKSGLNCLTYSDDESKMLIRRILQKLSPQFLCFSKNISYALCEQIQKTIAQIKSCNISCKEFKEAYQTCKSNVYNKFHDLSLIYDEYENMLFGRLDSSAVLTLFNSLIENSNNFKNTIFYFAGFDSLTAQGYQILKTVFNISKETVVGVLKSNQPKSYVYDNEMFNNVVNLFGGVGKCEIETIESNLKGERLHIFNNVFAYKKTKKFTSAHYASVLEANNPTEEVEYVAKQIAYLTKNQKCKFKDICVCADESYYPIIRNLFSLYEISFFDDQCSNVLDTTMAKFIIDALSLKDANFQTEDLIRFVKNDFAGIDFEMACEIENFILQNGIKHSKIKQLNDFDVFAVKFLNEIAALDKKQKLFKYVEFIKKLFQSFNARQTLENLADMFYKLGDFANQKVYLQIYNKTEEILNQMQNLLGNEEILLSDFIDLISCSFNSLEIRSVPISADCVFVGDAKSSFYAETKYMFVLGANEDNLPVVVKDAGLVPDSDISEVSFKINISPTVKMINRRNKFKMFDILTQATDKVYVCYSLLTEDGKKNLAAHFVNDLLDIYSEKVFNKISFLKTFAADTDELVMQKLKFNVPNVYEAKKFFGENKKFSSLVKQALEKQKIALTYKKQNKNSIKDAKNLFFTKNKTKTSQIECYYNCPFMHFVKYGLQLEENKTSVLQANDFGNILHKVAEKFISYNLKKLGQLTEAEIKDGVNIIISECKREFKSLEFDENKFILKLLTEEALRFCSFINTEQKHSKFKPKYLEKYFGAESQVLSVQANNTAFNISGIADRIDEYENYFRIIDYKTGNTQNTATYKALYYGTKIQIFVYIKAIENLTNKKVYGAFYLPISNSFNTEDQVSYKMKGFFLNDYALAQKCDDTLSIDNPQSNFFEAELSVDKNKIKKGDISLKGKKCIDESTMQNMVDYALKIVQKALLEILQGNIMAAPIDDACKNCQYANICEISENKNNIRKMDVSVDRADFSGGDNG